MDIRVSSQSSTKWDALLLSPKGFGLLLAGILAIVFWPVLSGAESFFYRDYGVLGYPFVSYAKERFLAGEFPLWNPYSNTGAPFAAQWGTMCFYPGSLVYILLPLPWSLGLFSLVHLWFAGMGMRWLAVKWTDSPAAGAVAAVAFVFNGAVLGALMWPNWVAALAWMPWIVGWLTDTAMSWRTVPKLALAGAAQLMTGVPELTVFTWLAGGVLAMGTTTGDPGAWAKAGLKLATGFVLVLLLGAVQLLPFLELLENSQRAGGAFADARWPMPLTGWANLFVPLFRSFATPDGQFYQFGQEFLSSYYFPLGAWLCAVAVFDKGTTRRAWLLAGLTVFALWMALGPAGGLFTAVKTVFPPIAVGRFPVKFVFLAAFTLPLLAAMGIARATTSNNTTGTKRLWLAASGVGGLVVLLIWMNHAGEAPFKPYQRTAEATANAGMRLAWLAAGALLATLALRKPIWHTAALGGFCATLLLDGLTHRPWQNPTIESAAMQAGFWPTNVARPEAGRSRFFIPQQAEDVFLKDASTNVQRSFLAKRVGQWSNLNLLDRVPKVNGSSTLQARWQWEFQKALYAAPETEIGPMLDFLGVTAMTSPSNLLEVVARGTALPLVTAGQTAMSAEGTNALAEMLRADFRPTQTVLLSASATDPLASPSRADAKVGEISATAERIGFTVTSPVPTVAVIAQTWMPGWQATVNGKTTPVWRANHAFMAVDVPKGESTVELRYAPTGASGGAIASVSGLLVCVAWMVWARRKGSE